MKKHGKNNRRKHPKRKNYNLSLQHYYTSRQSIGLTGIDPHMYVTLKYVENFSVIVATTVAGAQLMRMNSGFDPNFTGVGHQPYQWDQFAALYNRYRVLNTKWKVIWGNNTGTYNVCVFPLNGLLSSAVAGPATFETACEQPRAVVRIVPGTGGFPCTITGKVSLNALNGCTITEYLGDDRFEATVTTNPVEVMYLNACYYNPTLASITINFTIEMEYELDFHDVISVAGS